MNKNIKIFLTIILLAFTITVNALKSVNVGAIVGNINPSPLIISYTPNDSLLLTDLGVLVNYSFTIKNIDSGGLGESLTYTITSSDGAINLQNGTISNTSLLLNGTATIPFTHFTSSTDGSYDITLTLNDGVNLVVKKLNLYAF